MKTRRIVHTISLSEIVTNLVLVCAAVKKEALAKKRFGLSVLNYMIPSNHVHLLIKDTGPNVIADSMQLIAGRTAQEYNERKGRHGAFWEDRYHATAIEANEHLHRCLVYRGGLWGQA